MSNKGELNYTIVDGDGSPLNAGVAEEDVVREAQTLANARGESVGYYEEGTDEGGPITWVSPRAREAV